MLSGTADWGAETHESCSFGDRPTLVIDTGHPAAPEVQIWQCKVCGHGVTRPPMPDVAPLYEGRASEDFLSRDTVPVRILKMIAVKELARSLLGHASGAVKKVADFGAGNGMLANAFATQADRSVEVYAFDFFDDAPPHLAGAHYRSFAQSKALQGEIDLLTCFHVLEHSDDPGSILSGLKSYLRPGGTLVVEVPNVDCVWTPWFGKYSGNWYVPYHRVHFSRTSLRNLFEHHGLEILAEQDVCGPTFAVSLASLLGVKPNSALFALALLLRPVQWMAEKITRRPSALRIIARTPNLPA